MNYVSKTGIGQDSHPFSNKDKKLILGGVFIPNHKGLRGNSDADVILHAITNAVSSLSTVPILGAIADKMCQEGQRNSEEYLKKALETLSNNQKIVHIAVTVEAQKPRLAIYIQSIRKNIARICQVSDDSVGLTVTSGEGLTACGCGEGISVIAIVSLIEPLIKKNDIKNLILERERSSEKIFKKPSKDSLLV